MLGLSVHQWLFGILSFLAVLFSLMVVFSRSPVNSVLYLIMSFFSISGIYLLLDAQFLAIVNIVVYAGAIMVLFLFVIMLMNLNHDTEPQRTVITKIIAGVLGGLFLLVMTSALKGADTLNKQFYGTSEVGLIKNLGKVLFTEFLFPFEIVSVLLLAAMVGAVLMGKKKIH
ncbi:MAG TPA: NADH-quinone oxidoreductase subunit J [Bacteroidia bacterium]|nr:NADH-quinone oxidoreductase subunit J [Bacteroidia bacterium]